MSSESDDEDIAKKIKEESDEESEKEKDKKNKENLEEKQKKKDEVKEKENKKEDKKEDKKDEEKEVKATKGKEDKKKQESSDSGSSDSDSSEKDKKKKKSTKEADSRKDKNEKQKEKSEDKNSKKEEPKASKKRKESSSSSDSSSESNKKDNKKKDKDNKKNVDSDDEKEGENKNKKKENQEENADKIKEKKEKEEKEKKEKEEKERLERQKQKEIEAKEREEREKDRERRKAEKETDRGDNNRGNDRFERRNDGGFNNRGNDRFDRRNDGGFNNRGNDRFDRRNDGGFNNRGNDRFERRNDGGRPFGRDRYFDNPPREEINYVQKQAKKYDNNEVKALKSIISENEEIITEMKNAYPEITKLECANVIKNIKNSNAQTIFEIMNFIHREISIQITLNNNESNRETYILPNDPFEIIDPLYNNQDHIKVMKYYKVYSNEDKEKLPTFVQKMLSDDFYYTDNSTRRRPLIKYSNGGFNYIPIKCEKSEECKKDNCPYSHTDNEMFYHPLYYKTRFYNSEKEGYNSKNANDYINDFRIIYNYKNQNIINLLKLLDEKKIAKSNFRDYYKKKMKSFKLETFKTIECLSIKSGMKCPKDPHLCYYYHNPAERRRPPTLYRYSNLMCPDQKYKENGKIKSSCKNGDFCNKCHSRYEYYYHKLFFGKAITCIRQKKKGKCIFEETCYGYHPYKEKDYKKTKEEKIQEEKDLLMDKYNEEVELLSELISKYKCQKCGKYNKKFKFFILVNCGHIVCHKCFKENKKSKCLICKEKYDLKKENEDYFALNIMESSENIDKLIQEKYKKKKERKNEKEEDKKVKEEKEVKKEEDINKGNDDKKEDKKDDKNEDKNDEKKEDKKDEIKNNKTDEKDKSSDSDSENNNSMS